MYIYIYTYVYVYVYAYVYVYVLYMYMYMYMYMYIYVYIYIYIHIDIIYSNGSGFLELPIATIVSFNYYIHRCGDPLLNPGFAGVDFWLSR